MIGSFVVDLMARTPHLPAPAETVKGSFFKMGPGGKGFNQAVAAHKAGADIALVTKLGHDSFANVALDTMNQLGISDENILYSDTAETGIALILVDENTSQNEIIVVPGACDSISEEEISALEEKIAESDYLLLQLEINFEANRKAIEIAKKHGTKVILNTAPYSPFPLNCLADCYMVTPNEVEAESITGVKVYDFNSAKKAASFFHEQGVENVIITMGSQGCFVSNDHCEKIVPAYKVNSIDTTGAGDAFNGGLLAGLSENMEIIDAVKFATALAALSVQKIGTTPSMPTRSEIEEFIKAHSAFEA